MSNFYEDGMLALVAEKPGSTFSELSSKILERRLYFPTGILVQLREDGKIYWNSSPEGLRIYLSGQSHCHEVRDE